MYTSPHSFAAGPDVEKEVRRLNVRQRLKCDLLLAITQSAYAYIMASLHYELAFKK